MAAAAVKTNVTELPESRVRVEAEVPADEVERRVQQAARQLGRDLRVPGFRRGKVPPPVVLRRVGREAVLDEAVRGALGAWYSDAIEDAGIAPVGDPDLDLGELPEQGQPLTFSIEIGVRPAAKLGDYKGLEVGRREPVVTGEQVDAELEQLRERLAKLEPVQRPAADGDFVVIDHLGTVDGEPFAGGEARDQPVELGAGNLIPGFEEQLRGSAAGDELTIEVTFPDDYGAQPLAGKDASFAVTVKEVRERSLPDLDDDFAVDAAGVDSLQELRDEVGERLAEAERETIEREFRDAVLDSAVAAAKVDVPEPLVQARAQEMWEQMGRVLQARGIAPDAYLQATGKTTGEVRAEAEPEARRALAREAVLAAVVEAEAIEPDDADLLAALEHEAVEHEKTTPEKLLKQVRKQGRIEPLRRDVATSKALDVLVESAKPISIEQAQAREKLWTPGAGEGAAEGARGELWTPGS